MHEITERHALLDEQGRLTEPGYARSLILNYDRSAIKAPKLRIKEWDYYLVTAPGLAVALTIDDNSYMGLDSVSLLILDPGKPWEITTSLMQFMTGGRKNLPPTSDAGDVHTKAHQSDTVFITEGCGYSAYYFGETNSGRYCEAVGKVARAVEGKAQVYCLIAPLSTGIMLSDEVRSDLGFSDENKAMAWMFEHMDPLVKAVPVYGALKLHNDEDIFFHTDHHWTALGAYYAYREFCAQKGVRPHELSEFESHAYPGYQGSFVGYSNGSAELKNNPDTLMAWVPNGTNTMTTYIAEGGGYSKLSWPIVKDVSNYSKGSYYLGFVSGDRPWSYAHNEAHADGSSVLVVKDSFGNAFIPWVIDHYEHIYWIDYREYAKWCPWAGVPDSSISNFVERNEIGDVILLNQIGSTGSSTNLKDIEAIFR